MSASILGKSFGLTGAEMNRALEKLGYLKGIPGNWQLTEKGLKFAREASHHRGTGGYAWYNRDWTTRTFDDSILKEIGSQITDELEKQIRSEATADRLKKVAERAKPGMELLANQAGKVAEPMKPSSKGNIKKAGVAAAIAVAVIGGVKGVANIIKNK